MSQSHQRSNVSQNSTIYFSHATDSVEQLSDAGLHKLVNTMKLQNKVLTLENEVLEKTITRLDPSMMTGVNQALEYAVKIQSLSPTTAGSFLKSQTSKFSVLNSPSRAFVTSPSKLSTRRVESSARFGASTGFAAVRINILEKSELVSEEVRIIVSQLETTRAAAAKRHAFLKAQLEEIDLRMEDIQKATERFNQHVIIEGWDQIAHRIPAEIWIRFMTEGVKIADSQIGKLRLRTSTLNAQYSKLKSQIKVKEELSEQLRPVDFEKIKIENSVCVEIIESKKVQLGELKKLTGDANLNLTVHKKQMLKQNNYLNKILKTIDKKKKHTIAIDKETDLIRDQVEKLALDLNEIKSLRQEYEVPDILDYVHVKDELSDLKRSIKVLENKHHIQEIALKSLHKKIRTRIGHD